MKKSLAVRLLERFSGQVAVIAVPRLFIEVTGDHAVAVVLSQLLYHRGYHAEQWFCLSDEQLMEEVCLTSRQLYSIRLKLRPFGVRSRRMGVPAQMHYNIDMETLQGILTAHIETNSKHDEASVLPNGRTSSTKRKNLFSQNGRTSSNETVELISTNKEELNKRELIKGAKPANAFDPLQVQLPDCITPELWAEYVQMRRETRHPLTPTAVKRLLADLTKWQTEYGPEATRATLMASIRNGWRGVFPPRPQAQKTAINGSTEAMPKKGDQDAIDWNNPEVVAAMLENVPLEGRRR